MVPDRNGITLDRDGNVTVHESGQEITLPLLGLYRVQEVSAGGSRPTWACS